MMKPIFRLYFIAGLLLLGSCEVSPEPEKVISSHPEIFHQSEKLYFSTFPQSNQSVKFLINPTKDEQSPTRLILLNQDADTLETIQLQAASFHQWRREGELNYDFEEGKSYQLIADQKINPDSIFRYQLPDYQHNFKSQLSKNTLAQFERLNNFDLCPDRSFLFFNDFTGNVHASYRLELNTGNLLKLDAQLAGKIRVLDKDKLLYVKNGIHESEILLYDLEKNSHTFFGLTRGNSGSISRVVDGHVVYTNPIVDGERTLTVVNVETDERKIIPDFSFGNTIKEYLLGQMIFGNSLFNIENGTLEELSPFIGTALLQYNDDEELIFFRQGLGPESFEAGFSSKLIVSRKGGEAIFETPLEKSVMYYLPSETRLLNDKFIFYVAYGPDQDEHRVSGFYQADLTRGTMKLIHAEHRLNVSPNGLVQLEDNLWLGLFSGEISLYQLD